MCGPNSTEGGLSLAECKDRCLQEASCCDGFSFRSADGQCILRHQVVLGACVASTSGFDSYRLDQRVVAVPTRTHFVDMRARPSGCGSAGRRAASHRQPA